MAVQLFAMIFLMIFESSSFNNAGASKGCKNLEADLKKGTLNGVSPAASMKEVKSKLPCFTGDSSEEDSIMNCGGGVFYLNHDFFFYTGRNYIEIRKNFKGKLSAETLNQPWSKVHTAMGEPDRQELQRDVFYYFYDTDYGCLRFNVVSGNVIIVAMHAQPSEQVDLCF